MDSASRALLNSLHRHVRSTADALMIGDTLTAVAECGYAEQVLAAYVEHVNGERYPAAASA